MKDQDIRQALHDLHIMIAELADQIKRLQVFVHESRERIYELECLVRPEPRDDHTLI